MRGGYRKNAGRKQGASAKKAEEARRVLSELVMRNIIPIGKALVAKAKNGDVVATRELFDRAFGKSPSNLGIDSPDYGKSAVYLPVPLLENFEKNMKRSETRLRPV
jgi:hypothetical protein